MKYVKLFEGFPEANVDIKKINDDLITEVSIIRDFYESLQEKFPKSGSSTLGSPRCSIDCSNIGSQSFDDFSVTLKKIFTSDPLKMLPTIQYNIGIEFTSKDDNDIVGWVDKLMDKLDSFDSNCEMSQFSSKKDVVYRKEKCGRPPRRLKEGQTHDGTYLITNTYDSRIVLNLINKEKSRYSPEWTK